MDTTCYRIITALLIIFTLVFSIFPFSLSAEKYCFSEEVRQTTVSDVKLHFHRDNVMDTSPPTSNAPTANVLRDGTGLEFVLNPALYSDLNVKGQVKVDDKEALLLILDVNYVPIGSSTASITINVIDDSTTIATNTFSLPHETSYRIPFTGGKTDHTFTKGSLIKVNITASVTGQPTIRVTYDHESYPGFFYVTCYQIISMSFGAFHHDGSSGEFAPNAPENRVINFEGEIKNAFGGYDISRVELDVTTLASFPDNAVATINVINEKAIYYFNWSYPYGLSPGQYEVQSTIYDNSDNTFSDTTTFTIASFDVFLEIVEPEKSNEKGKTVVFELELTNIGGNHDTFTLSASPSLSWQVSFDSSSMALNANETGYPKLTVTIPSNADDNQQNLISVTATSTGNPSKQDSVSAIATALPTTGFSFELLDPATQDITETQTATYSMRLVNVGQNTETFVIQIRDNPQSGWVVVLEGGNPASTVYSRREATLDSGGQLNFDLSVSSSNPSSYTQVVVVTAYLKNDTSKTRDLTTTTNLLAESEILLKAKNSELTSIISDISAEQPTYSSLDFTVNVNNLGAEVQLIFSYILPENTDGWTVTKPSEIILNENQNKDVKFTITPDSDTLANENDGFDIKLTATSTNDPDIEASVTVTAFVKQFYRLEVNIEDDKIVAGSNKEESYGIIIKNNGNGNDIVEIIVSRNDWDYDLASAQAAGNGGETLSIPIAAGAEARATLTVTSPADAKNGDSGIIKLSVRSSEFNTDDEYTYFKFTVTTKVEKSGAEAFTDLMQDPNMLVLIGLVVAVIIVALFIKYKLKEKQRS